MTLKIKAKKKSNALNNTMTAAEDDGTQVERGTKRVRRTHTKKITAESSAFREAFKEFCTNTNKIGVQGLMQEFASIRAETQPIGDKRKTTFDTNIDKNRYKDVFCLDATRVVLNWPAGGNDYIHANWVTGTTTSKKFICTQGPTEKTVEDLWRMVWQEKCRSIVMLCNVIECGKKKCERYWPVVEQPSMTFPCKLTVNFIKTEELEKNIFLTKLEVSDEHGEKLMVDHVQWKDWPDRGVPETNLSVFRLLVRVKNLTPIVVHCSAGIGRTGTVVGMDILYSRLDKGENVTFATVVRGLRDDRHGSVQTDVQYVYMHRILLAVAENKKVITSAEIEKFITDYDAMCKAKGF